MVILPRDAASIRQAGACPTQLTIAEMLDTVARYQKPEPKRPSIIEAIERIGDN